MMPEPGKQTGHLTVVANGDEVRVPVATATGRGDGPTVLVVAGVHGSEYVGIEATKRFFGWVDVDRLEGKLITVPCLNVPAFYALSMHVNPVDARNLGDEFPGSEHGTLTERLAWTVFDSLVSEADFVLDVHGGDLEEELVEYSQVNFTGNEAVDRPAEALARALDMPMFLRSPAPEALPDRGGLFEMASILGKPGVLLEAGSHGDLDESAVAVHFKALRNALHHLEMLPGERLVSNPRPVELHRFLGVEAPVEGSWYPFVTKGETVRAGQALGEIRDFFGARLAVLTSGEDAVVLGVMTIPPRRKGDWVIGLGTLG